MGKIQTSFFDLVVLGTREISNYILLREGDDFDRKPTVCHISHDYFNKLSIIAVDKNSWIFNILERNTVCPRNSDPYYIVSYYIKRVTTSWTHSSCAVRPNSYREIKLLVAVGTEEVWILRTPLVGLSHPGCCTRRRLSLGSVMEPNV